MGSWNINIQGIGQHNNDEARVGKASVAKDANRMANEFVQKLKDAGHTVEHATFTAGNAEVLEGNLYKLPKYTDG